MAPFMTQRGSGCAREADMNEDLAAFLNNRKPLAEAWPVWGNGRVPLRQHTYLSPGFPLDHYVSSARAILFRGDEVMVVLGHDQQPYVVPGGRRELGESIEATLHREVLEETGWRLAQTCFLGFVHFCHLGSKPEAYPYPFPDFVQVIYTAVADAYHPEAICLDDYVTSACFYPLAEVFAMNLEPDQTTLLTAALKQYEAMQ